MSALSRNVPIKANSERGSFLLLFNVTMHKDQLLLERQSALLSLWF